MTAQSTDDRSRRRKALVAWGALAGVAALATTAAFTDVARLQIGSNGLGGADSSYNIQVGATDAQGQFIPGWQEASGTAVPIALDGAESLFPGSGPISVDIPVRNDSPTYPSTLALELADLPGGGATDADYLSSLRFDVHMPATSREAEQVSATRLTFGELSHLVLNQLAPGEESTVKLSVSLLTQAESGAAFDDNSLSGKGAYLQASLNGSSI